MSNKDDLIKLIETMEKDICEILENLNSPDHIRKYATCLVLDICHLRLIAESEEEIKVESIIDRHNLTRIDDVMSNFDHAIERDIEERLRKGDCYAGYPAYNFHGNVAFKDNKFICEIKRYSSLVDIIEGDTLEEIMEEASNTYGWD